MNVLLYIGDPNENRTRDCALRGRRLSRLTMGPQLLEYNNIGIYVVQELFLKILNVIMIKNI